MQTECVLRRDLRDRYADLGIVLLTSNCEDDIGAREKLGASNHAQAIMTTLRLGLIQHQLTISRLIDNGDGVSSVRLAVPRWRVTLCREVGTLTCVPNRGEPC